jgi:hypothetical protein
MVEYVLSLKNYYSQIVIRVVVAENASFAIFCIFYLFCLLVLVPCTDNTPIPIDDTQEKTFSDYEPLAGKQGVCPERKSNIISFLLFDWMTPLMRLGYKRPIGDKDIWQLDTSDKTGIVYSNFQQHWHE